MKKDIFSQVGTRAVPVIELEADNAYHCQCGWYRGSLARPFCLGTGFFELTLFLKGVVIKWRKKGK